METAYAVVLSFFFIIAIHRVLNRRRHGKNVSMQQLPPGPLAVPVLGHLPLLKKPVHHAFLRLAARYGPVFSLRLGSRDAVVVSSAECARECLTEHDVTFANRPFYPTLHLMAYGGAAVGNCSYGPYWRHVRRILSEHLLSPHRVSSMLPTITAEVRAMARRIYRAAAAAAAPGGTGSTRVEVRGRLVEVSLSALMETIAQTKTSRAEDDDADMSPEAHEFKETLDVMVPLVGTASSWDYLPILQRFDVFFGVKKKMAAAVSTRDAFFRRLIDAERRRLDGDGAKSESKSMMAVLLNLQKSDPENYSDQVIMSLCFSMFTGGAEPTATAAEWAMSLLMNHPEVMKKAQAEIDTVVGTSRLLAADDMPRLSYLQCVLTETLRLYPVLPTLIPHESAKDATVGGHRVPGGTMLFVNVYAIHRGPVAWTDPDAFRPERFEDGGAAQGLLMPFGMGRRRCPGEMMATRTVGLVLGTLIQCFDWETIDGAPKVDLTEGAALTLPKAIPLEAVCKPRQVMLDALRKL